MPTILALIALAGGEETLLNRVGAPLPLELQAEIGFLAPLAHTVQFSSDGTRFNYVKRGGQDVLFAFFRLQAETRLADRHFFTLLYQPLDIRTRVTLDRPLIVDGAIFHADSALATRYSFPFWRLAYLYDFVDGRDELGVGGSLQIRNATIDFVSGDGALVRSNRDVGPVPLLKARARFALSESFWVGGEVDGIYAPIKYFNGGDTDVEGAFIDLSARAGLCLAGGAEAFLNVRYLGGGAEGTGDSDGFGDGYVSNWLHFLTVSIGFTLR